MSAMSRAEQWMAGAPAGLAHLIRRLTWHHQVKWEVPDYVEDVEDHRSVTTDLDQLEAVSSQRTDAVAFIHGDRPIHALLLDIDLPSWLVPSTRPDHHHLYVDLTSVGHVGTEQLAEFLLAAAKIGLVEEGYAKACIARGMTSLRAPWVRKGQEHESVPVPALKCTCRTGPHGGYTCEGCR